MRVRYIIPIHPIFHACVVNEGRIDQKFIVWCDENKRAELAKLLRAAASYVETGGTLTPEKKEV